MIILGLSFDYHDAAAALVVDGRVVSAAQEERFSRQKNDPSYPKHAIDFCLRSAECTAADLEAVAFYERPLRKFDRIVKTFLKNGRRDRLYLEETIADWFRNGKFEVNERIAHRTGVPVRNVVYVGHHVSHAASAFFCSPFDEAVVVTVDGVGEHETFTVSHGHGTRLDRIHAAHFPHSIGLFYSAFTAYLGFEINEGEYKVMGMAGYGEPIYADELKNLFRFDRSGGFELSQDYFQFEAAADVPYTEALVRRFGMARVPEARFALNAERPAVSTHENVRAARHYADIAASVQRCTEDVMLHLVESAMRRTGQSRVCLAGGVALNSAANGRIRRKLGCDLYVHPAAGDAGGAIGAALYHYHATLGRPRRGPLVTPYLGFAPDDRDIEAALDDAFVERFERFSNDEDLVREVARRLAAGQVLGWCQGRAEWGPRALGARSILASPTLPEMKGRINEKIKFREPFRPFAPSVLEERAHEYFELPESRGSHEPEYFMLAVYPVRSEHRATIPAAVHVDGTARLHLVSSSISPLYHKLISAFSEQTGVPVLVNTSFNLRGEPIVNTPADALRTFQWSGLDALAVGRYLITKDGL